MIIYLFIHLNISILKGVFIIKYVYIELLINVRWISYIYPCYKGDKDLPAEVEKGNLYMKLFDIATAVIFDEVHKGKRLVANFKIFFEFLMS
jgi:hypothetical protein